MTDAGAPPGPVEDFLSLVRDGQAKFASGDVEQARAAFAKALALKPEHPGAKAGLERCERLLAEREKEAPAEPPDAPAWPTDGPRNEDFPDSGENPEATIVDPNYLRDLSQGPDAGSSGEFPEPLTMPRAPIEKRLGETPTPEARGTPPAAGEPAYPRYVATMPGNYPEVRSGGRPAVASPPPAHGAAGVVAYPQMPPGGPSPYPQFVNPVGGYLPTPPPMPMQLWQQHRSMMITAGVGAGCLALGLLLGWAMFGASDDDEPRQAGTVAPLVTRDAGSGGGAAAPRASDAGAVAQAGAGAAATARVTVIGRPVLEAVTAPSTGQVTKLHARASAQVKMGTRLYTIRAGGKKSTAPESVVFANRAGRFEVRAGEGDAVESGDVLALLVDPEAWLLVVDTTGDAIKPAWRCEVASGDGLSRSHCRVDSVENLGGGRTRATARVAAKDAGWLKGDEKDLTVTLTAP